MLVEEMGFGKLHPLRNNSCEMDCLFRIHPGKEKEMKINRISLWIYGICWIITGIIGGGALRAKTFGIGNHYIALDYYL